MLILACLLRTLRYAGGCDRSGVNSAGIAPHRAGHVRLALRNGRKKVTIFHQANVQGARTGIFPETVREVAKPYGGRIAVEDRIVASAARR